MIVRNRCLTPFGIAGGAPFICERSMMNNCLCGIAVGLAMLPNLFSNCSLRSQESKEILAIERAMADALPLLSSKRTSGLFSRILDSQLDLLPDALVLDQSRSYLQNSESEEGKRQLLSYILVRFGSRNDGYDLVLELLPKYPRTVRIRGQGLSWWLVKCFGLHGIRLLIEAAEKSPPGAIRIDLLEEVELVFGEWVEMDEGTDFLEHCKDWLQRNWRNVDIHSTSNERPEGLLPSPTDNYDASPIGLRGDR